MRRILAASLVASFGLACGGSSGGSPSAPNTPTGPVTISIVGVRGQQSFSPNPAVVSSGRTVIWKNNDTVVHRVRLNDGSLDTGDIQPGASTQPMALGNVSKAYSCSLHPNMVGSLNQASTPEPPPCTGYCG
jgi:plastocyanin